MKRSWMIFGMVMGMCAASDCWAQDKKASDKDKPATTEKKDVKAEGKEKADAKPEAKDKKPSSGDMESWMKMAAAGEHHKKLDSLVGTWNLVIKSPGEEGPDSKGKVEFKWIMDGRFLVETAKSDMSGMTFEWMGWHGYDNQKKQYVSAWVDNFGTGIDAMTGQFDDAKKTLTYVGETDNPGMGGKVAVKWIMHLESKDRFTTVMLEGAGNGKEKKVMEIVATRS